jgi:hypothetical protein
VVRISIAVRVARQHASRRYGISATSRESECIGAGGSRRTAARDGRRESSFSDGAAACSVRRDSGHGNVTSLGRPLPRHATSGSACYSGRRRERAGRGTCRRAILSAGSTVVRQLGGADHSDIGAGYPPG